jgi:preprotein translocase subunit Sec61beta
MKPPSPKTVQIYSQDAQFPGVCVMCGQPARETYPFERTFPSGRRGLLVKVHAPLCSAHLALATRKSRGERISDRAGLIGGILVGIAAAAGLWQYWTSTGQGSAVMNPVLAGVMGIGMFLIVWLATIMWLSPTIASRDTKAVRGSLILKRYWPEDDLLEVYIENEAVARLVQRANHSETEPAEDDLYTLEALLVCAELQLTTLIDTQVHMDHLPSALEAERLLLPVAEAKVASGGGKGAPFVLQDLEVIPGDWGA